MCFGRLGEEVTGPDYPSRVVDTLVIHCSATQYGVEFDANDIHGWHLENGWTGIGYHYVILTDGKLQKGRDDCCEGAHASGHNDGSIGICLIGGVDENNVAYDNGYSPEQYKTLVKLLGELVVGYNIATIGGHKELPDVNKACPCLSKDYLDLIRSMASSE